MRINASQLRWAGKSQTVKASEIGLQAGLRIPDAITVVDDRQPGERMYYRKQVKRGPSSELVSIRYESAAGRRLLITND
jgi:hypothetical protein